MVAAAGQSSWRGKFARTPEKAMNIEKELSKLKEQDQLRSLLTLPDCGGKFFYNGMEMLNFPPMTTSTWLATSGSKRLPFRLSTIGGAGRRAPG
jgi:hypothetical protein